MPPGAGGGPAVGSADWRAAHPVMGASGWLAAHPDYKPPVQQQPYNPYGPANSGMVQQLPPWLSGGGGGQQQQQPAVGSPEWRAAHPVMGASGWLAAHPDYKPPQQQQQYNPYGAANSGMVQQLPPWLCGGGGVQQLAVGSPEWRAAHPVQGASGWLAAHRDFKQPQQQQQYNPYGAATNWMGGAEGGGGGGGGGGTWGPATNWMGGGNPFGL